jgi:hypothetical protein
LLLSKCRKNNDVRAYNKKGLTTGSIAKKKHRPIQLVSMNYTKVTLL